LAHLFGLFWCVNPPHRRPSVPNIPVCGGLAPARPFVLSVTLGVAASPAAASPSRGTWPRIPLPCLGLWLRCGLWLATPPHLWAPLGAPSASGRVSRICLPCLGFRWRFPIGWPHRLTSGATWGTYRTRQQDTPQAGRQATAIRNTPACRQVTAIRNTLVRRQVTVFWNTPPTSPLSRCGRQLREPPG